MENDRPAKYQEQALVAFYNDRTNELINMVSSEHGPEIAEGMRDQLFSEIPGIAKGLARMKPYTGTHNSGYTECQEFYGAITMNSKEPLGEQIVIMLDVAIRGIGDYWDDIVIPGMDFVVVENTCGKYGRDLRELNRIPHNVQGMVGNIDEIG